MIYKKGFQNQPMFCLLVRQPFWQQLNLDNTRDFLLDPAHQQVIVLHTSKPRFYE